MARLILALLITIALVKTVSFGAAPPAVTPEKIDEAVKKGVEYLYSKQNNGHWERAEKRDPTTKNWDTEGGQFGGRTALVTYALLASDESPQDERIVKAVNWLRKADVVGT